MSRIFTQRRTGLIISSLLLAGVGVFFTWQQLNAQGGVPTPMGGGAGGAGGSALPGYSLMMPGMPGGSSQSNTQAAAPAAPKGPVFTLSKVAHGIQIKSVKNWDGKVMKMLRFKYQLEPKRVITVVLPEALAKEENTKEGWVTLFQVFSMDQEAKLDAQAKMKPVNAARQSTGGTGSMMGGMPMGGMPTMPGGMPSTMPGGMPMLPGMPVR